MLKLKNQEKNQQRQKSLEEDKNKFKKVLAIIDSNKLNYRNKIGEFMYIDIRDQVNKIRNYTISETDAQTKSKYIKQNQKRRNNKT